MILLALKTTDAEPATNEYHTSSSANPAAQLGAKAEAVAFTVEATVGVVQVVPNGFVITAIAPVHSSLAGACAEVLLLVPTSAVNNNKICTDFFIIDYILRNEYCVACGS